MTRIFLSYARSDDERFAKRLYQDLTKRGFDVWWDREKMPGRGLTFLQEIRDAIAEVDRLILILGPQAIESEYVRVEWEFALSICKVINPILRLGNYDLIPAELRHLDIPDFRDNKLYSSKLEYLCRQLAEPTTELSRLWDVPSLPPHYLPRTKNISELNRIMLADLYQPKVITSEKKCHVLHGMGGVGKSALAIEFCRSCETRRIFQDGVFWLSFAHIQSNVKFFSAIRTVAIALGDQISKYTDYETSKGLLGVLLESKNCLFVLDDVISSKFAEVFMGIVGSRCRVLVTTREGEISTSLGSTEHQLEILNEDSALNLMAQWLMPDGIGKDNVPTKVAEILHTPNRLPELAKECGYLPLALSLCAAQLSEGMSAEALLSALRNSELEFLDHESGSIMKSLKVSIDRLDKTEEKCYAELGVFHDSALIPESILRSLWLTTTDIKPYIAEKLLISLARKSLILLEGDAPNRRIRLHPLQYDYLQQLLINPVELHDKLLNAYAIEAPNGWASCEDDGYIFEHLAYHLVHADRTDDLVSTAKDLSYLAAKTFARNALATESDLSTALIYAPNDLSLSVLKKSYSQMTHLLGRCENLDEITSTLNSRLPQSLDLIQSVNRSQPDLRAEHTLPDLPHPSLMRTLSGHWNAVNGCAITPDNAKIVSASRDGSVKIWDAKTGQEKQTLKWGATEVTCCSLSRDGSLLLTGSYGVDDHPDKTSYDYDHGIPDPGVIIIWDMSTTTELRLLLGHTDRVFCCEMSPDGKHVVSGSRDKTLRIWDASSGTEELILYGHNDGVYCCAISPDGLWLVSGSFDGTLKIWDMKTGTMKFTLIGHKHRVAGCAISPDGSWIVSASYDGTLKMWDANSGQEIGTLTGHYDVVIACTISHDSKYILSAGDQTVRVWEAQTGIEKLILTGHTGLVVDCVFSSDRQSVISASYDHTIRIWDITGVEQVRTSDNPSLPIQRCSVTQDNLSVLSIGYGMFAIWDTLTGRKKRSLEDREFFANPCGISSDGTRVVAALLDGTIKVWDTINFGEVLSIEGKDSSRIIDLGFSSTDQYVVIAYEDGHILVCKTQTGRKVKSINTGNFINTCAINPNVDFIVTGGGSPFQRWLDPGYVSLYNVHTGKHIVTLEKNDAPINDCAISYAGPLVASASCAGELKIWDIQTGKLQHTFDTHSYGIYDGPFFVLTGGVTGCAFSSDGHWIASIGSDGAVKVWNIKTEQCVASIRLDGSLNDCSWYPDNHGLVVAGSLGLYFLEFVQPDSIKTITK